MVKADYRVRLRGRNFLLADGASTGRFAFDVTVFVQARDAEQARERAMQALAADEDLRGALRNATDDPPLVFTLETVAIPPELAPPPKRSALVLTPDDGSEPEPGLPAAPGAGQP
jgi:hypothetical protein